MALHNMIFERIVSLIFNEVVGTLFAVYLLHKFRVWNRLKKIFAYLFQGATEAEITLRLDTDKTARKLGKEVVKKWEKKNLPIQIITDDEDHYELDNNSYKIMIHEEEGELFFQTSKLDTTLGRIDSKFSEILSLVEKEKVNSVSLHATLPYRFEFVEVKAPSSMEIEDYEISLKKGEEESRVTLEMKNKKSNVKINGTSVNDIREVVKKVFSPWS